MKKIFISIFAACFLFAGCQSELEEKFYDPEKYQAPESIVMSGMFAKTVYQWKIFIQDYGEYWWGLSGTGPAAYAQIGVRPMIYDAIYNNWTEITNWNDNFKNSIGSYFSHMYERNRPWGLMKNLMETGDAAFVKENQLYFQLTSIIKDYCFLRNVDVFNSIPYSTALRGVEGVLFTEYDDPKEIYTTGLQNMKDFTEQLQSSFNGMSEDSKALFRKQDIAFGGDIQKWFQWATATRLKFAVRLSGVDEATAKTHIQDILSKNALPTQDLLWNPPFETLEATLSGGGETWTRGFIERFTSYFVPNVIMKRMNHGSEAYEPGTDDPRLPVLAMPTKWGDYRGVSMNRDAEKAIADAEKAECDDKGWTNKYTSNYVIVNYTAYRNNLDVMLGVNALSCYNLKTLVFNEPPVYMSSLAETDLLLAEIAERNLGSTGKNASEHIADAVKHSTHFWYEYNNRSTYEPEPAGFPEYSKAKIKEILSPAEPNAAIVNQYADFMKQQYNNASDKMEIIMQQKYIHLNMIGIYELWSELRRTRRPKLEPVTTLNSVKAKIQLERMTYPSSEQSVNMENYKKVQDQDNYTSPVFWVKNPSESFYRNDFIE